MLDSNFSKENLKLFYEFQKLENNLIQFVNSGNSEKANQIYNLIFDKYEYYQLSENSLQSYKFHIVSLITLMSNTIINKGFSPYSVRAKSQAFIKLADSYTNISDLKNIGRIAAKAFCAQASKAKISSSNQYIALAINYIHDHLGEKISLDEVASHVFMNKCNFCSQFKDVTGHTFSDYVNIIRIERAKIFLSHTDKDITDIAVSLGFNSQAYFSTIFKKYTGITPSQFKSRNRGTYISELNVLNQNKF